MRSKVVATLLITCVVLGSSLATVTPVFGQSEVVCGDIIEGEFVENMEEHLYEISMAPGDSFQVEIVPIGDFLETTLLLFGPTGLRIGKENRGYVPVESNPTKESGALSARGEYTILVANAGISFYSDLDSRTITDNPGGIGVYTLSISCVQRDGTVIAPGDSARPTATPAPLPTPTVRPALADAATSFEGVGFPGIAPVDFSTVAKVPLVLDTPITGVVPTGNEILGFTFEAQAGDEIELTYERLSGNLNLGIVLLSEDNEVFFQTSLVTSDYLSTKLQLPTAGNYTIGIFRIALVEPSTPEGIVFRLTGSISSESEG